MSTRREPPAPAALSEMQHFLAEAFRQFVPLTERDDLADDIRRLVAGNDRLSPQEQAEIYREQFWLRHRDVLEGDYPGLLYILGDDGFADFARAYLTAHPPDSYTLRDLGNHIAAFADDYAFEEEKRDLARAMARFELMFVPIFDGPDVEPLAVERVQSLPPEAWASARIVFHPLHHLLELSHPVHRLRMAVKKGESPALPEPKATRLSMWRHPDMRVHFRENEELEHRLMQLLKQGADLGGACDRIASEADDPSKLAASLQRWFQAWAKRGWIVDVEVA